MAIPFEEIETGFGVIREAFVDDAEPLLESERGGPAVALLVAIGYEELSRLRLGKPRGEDSFAETLPAEWRPIARSLYGAPAAAGGPGNQMSSQIVRDGLAHGYGTQAIVVGEARIAIGLGRTLEPRPHRLDPTPFGELEADAVVILNTRKLVADLRNCFDGLEAELRQDGELRDALWGRWTRGRTRVVRDPKEVQEWRRLLGKPPAR